MEEEVTTNTSIQESIENGIKEIGNVKKDYVSEINELVKKSITDKDIENFELPELTDEQLKLVSATDDDIKLYNYARIFEHDKKDTLDVENYVDKELWSKYLDIDISSGNKEERNKAIKSLFLAIAYQLYMNYENKKFTDKVAEVSLNADPEEIIKAWFTHNNDLFGITEDLEMLEETEDNKFSIGRDAYKRALTLESIIEESKSISLNKLIKECSDKRYKRHLNRMNTCVRHHLKQKDINKKSKTINCDNIPLYTSLIIGHLIKMHDDKELFEKVIKLDNQDYRFSRAIVVLASLASNTIDLSSGDVIEPYFINMNLYMVSNIPTISETTDKCAERILEAVYNIIKNIAEKV